MKDIKEYIEKRNKESSIKISISIAVSPEIHSILKKHNINISGTINGGVRTDYYYTFRAVDPDNNPISWYIEWGDGTTIGWTSEWASNEKCYYEHKWLIRGDYTIRAKARDTLGEESDWAYLEVTMPMNQQTTSNSWWFLQFLQNHPRMFPILRHLFRLE